MVNRGFLLVGGQLLDVGGEAGRYFILIGGLNRLLMIDILYFALPLAQQYLPEPIDFPYQLVSIR